MKGHEIAFSRSIMAITIVNSQQLSLVALYLYKRSPARIQIWVGESISCGPTTYC